MEKKYNYHVWFYIYESWVRVRELFQGGMAGLLPDSEQGEKPQADKFQVEKYCSEAFKYVKPLSMGSL